MPGGATAARPPPLNQRELYGTPYLYTYFKRKASLLQLERLSRSSPNERISGPKGQECTVQKNGGNMHLWCSVCWRRKESFSGAERKT